jgi:hypothetical protein
MKDFEKLKILVDNIDDYIKLYRDDLLGEAKKFGHDMSDWYSVEWIVDKNKYSSHDTFCHKCVFEITINETDGELEIKYDESEQKGIISKCRGDVTVIRGT